MQGLNNMNELQLKEVELLKVFIDICKKNKLKYYLVCGTALGAVKYKGFIPWDDDIDVAMPREDYELFCTYAPYQIPEKYFLQTHKTESEFRAIYAKLRDSSTTFIESSVADMNINHGINIDIFPLDGYPQRKKEQCFLEFRKKIYVFILSLPNKRHSRYKEKIIKLLRFFFSKKTYDRVIGKYEKMIKNYCISSSEIIANHGNWQGKLDYTDKAVFGDGIVYRFEGLDVIIPSNYDAYLRKKYGDYEKDPPVDKQKSHHIFSVIDVRKPYSYYIDNLKT